ncbi:hypothetical protein OJ998_14445 [Solirubrobacter taibaiensis]|nr:hypothetical protein [Solirubrobacter taibaiensis]
MLDLPVPDPGPPGPYGTMPWLRATVSRFANGETHTRRRALVEARLAALDPTRLVIDMDVPVDRPYLPVAAFAAATGVREVEAAVAATRVVAAAYHPGTDAAGADAALAALLALLPPDEPEALAQHVALLVQTCEATAGLVRGDDLPVKTTKRVTADGTIVAVDLTGRPFGEGARRCPGERHARALAEALK